MYSNELLELYTVDQPERNSFRGDKETIRIKDNPGYEFKPGDVVFISDLGMVIGIDPKKITSLTNDDVWCAFTTVMLPGLSVSVPAAVLIGENPEIVTISVYYDGIQRLGPGLMDTGIFIKALDERSLEKLHEALRLEYIKTMA